MVKDNIETSHTNVNTANFKIIDMNFRVFMDQRLETYTKCIGEISTSEAL